MWTWIGWDFRMVICAINCRNNTACLKNIIYIQKDSFLNKNRVWRLLSPYPNFNLIRYRIFHFKQ